MKKFLILLLFSVIVFSACSDKCKGYACFSPPMPFRFELVDKTSGEDLFDNGTFDPQAIAISNSLNGDIAVDFSFIRRNGMNLIAVGSIGWETETVDLKVKIGEQAIFSFYVDAIRKSEDCCNFTEYTEIRLEGREYEFISNIGVYKILYP